VPNIVHEESNATIDSAARRTYVHQVMLAEMPRGVKMKQSEGELHPGGEQQGEETSGADQPAPAAFRVEMRPHAGNVYA